jgi:hypothetical protein
MQIYTFVHWGDVRWTTHTVGEYLRKLRFQNLLKYLLHAFVLLLGSNFLTHFVQQSFCEATSKQFLTTSLPVKRSDDSAIKWDIKTHFSGLLWGIRTFFKKYFVDLGCLNWRRYFIFPQFLRIRLAEIWILCFKMSAHVYPFATHMHMMLPLFSIIQYFSAHSWNTFCF